MPVLCRKIPVVDNTMPLLYRQLQLVEQAKPASDKGMNQYANEPMSLQTLDKRTKNKEQRQ